MDNVCKEKTLVLIKPGRGLKHIVKIKERLSNYGEIIREKSYSKAPMDKIIKTYKDHEKKTALYRGTPFHQGILDHFRNRPVISILLQGENIISEVTKLKGNPNPGKAKRGTIRHEYGNIKNYHDNCVHSSDRKSAIREIEIWFPA